MATVVMPDDVMEQYDQLPRKIKARMLKLVHRLQDWPEVSGVKALSGNLAGHYRLRTGDYRLQFRLEGDDVLVEKIGHRSTFYED